MEQTEPDVQRSRSLTTATSSNELTDSQERTDVDAVRYLRSSTRAQASARRRRWIVVLLGLVPLACTAAFIWFVATPMFSTETRFAVRGGDAQSFNISTFAGKGGAGADALGAFVDGYAVRDFLRSRAALKEVGQKLDFRAIAVRPRADPIVRLPKDATEEMLFNAFLSMVQVQYNIFEQIVVVQCFAFTPQESVTLCQTVVQISEAFADQMNRRAREDVLRVADTEVKLAEQRSLDARLAVNRWRDENSNVDPTADASMLGNLINQLETQRLASENSLAQIKAASPNSPRRSMLEAQVQTLRDQIAQQRARLGATGDSNTTANRIKSYETLKSTQDFADSNLTNLRQSLEQARIAMIRQQRFVAVISEPLMNDNPAYPSTITPLITSFIGGLALVFFGSVIFGMLRGLLFA